MRVHGIGNSPGYGQGPGGADRTNKDGAKRQHHQDQPPQKQPEEHDEVELHKPEDGDKGAAEQPASKPFIKPAAPSSAPAKGGGKPPHLDLSA